MDMWRSIDLKEWSSLPRRAIHFDMSNMHMTRTIVPPQSSYGPSASNRSSLLSDFFDRGSGLENRAGRIKQDHRQPSCTRMRPDGPHRFRLFGCSLTYNHNFIELNVHLEPGVSSFILPSSLCAEIDDMTAFELARHQYPQRRSVTIMQSNIQLILSLATSPNFTPTAPPKHIRGTHLVQSPCQSIFQVLTERLPFLCVYFSTGDTALRIDMSL